MMLRAAKAAKVQQSFLRARKGNSHAIEEVDNSGGHFAHRFGGWLIREKVPAINGVVKMFPSRIAFALGVDCAVDTTLRADRMRALNRHDGKEIDVMTGFGNLHPRRQSCKSASNYCDLDSFCHKSFQDCPTNFSLSFASPIARLSVNDKLKFVGHLRVCLPAIHPDE